MSKEQVLDILKTIPVPGGGQNIVEAGLVAGVVIKKDQIGFALEVSEEQGRQAEPLRREAEEKVRQAFPDCTVRVVLTAHTASAEVPASKPQGIAKIKHIIAVGSGKGGVGKSTVAVNLACALHQQGKSVGLLDADIYGPSIPMMTGIKDQAGVNEDKLLLPMESHGLKIMSIGLMIKEDSPMIWRGPMVISAIKQMLDGTLWGELDVLIVDMPPGTGDAQLTLSQHVPLAGALIVSTPQDVALLDVKKSVRMFQRVNVPILGLVENMSTFCCPHCNQETPIFGEEGAVEESRQLNLDCLVQIPIELETRTSSDEGVPVVVHNPSGRTANVFESLAQQVMKRLDRKKGSFEKRRKLS